jgi:hypothetical protein
MHMTVPAVLAGLARAKSPGVDFSGIMDFEGFEGITVLFSVASPRIKLCVKAVSERYYELINIRKKNEIKPEIGNYY